MSFIDPTDMSIRTLLMPAQTAYKVPLYQRPYAWKEEQWQDLIDDVKGLNDQELFLGSIVVVPQGKHHAGVNYFEVVDGQQRLTTLLIWFSAIRDLELEKGNEKKANYIDETFLFSKEFERNEPISIPKITLGLRDNIAFVKILKRQKNAQENLITDCYKFFKKQTYDSDLMDRLLDNIYLIHINAMSYVNAFRLFETLNDRGLELSAIDLIKNFILMHLTSENAKEEIINQTIENWNEIYQKLGKSDPVQFLRRYTMSNYKGKITETRLYETIKTKVQDLEVGDLVEFVKDINYKASIYEKIISESFGDEKVNNALSNLAMVEVGPSYILLMKLFAFLEEGKCQKPQIIEVLRMVETFHIRSGICGKTTSKLDQIYNELSNEISESNLNNLVNLVNERFTKELKLEADNISFERSFKTRSLKPSELRSKYILWKLSDPTGETIPDLSVIQTEHIMPQTLSPEWYSYLGLKTGKNNEEIKSIWEEYLNRIGNLAIIKNEWNARDSNKLFEVKKMDYMKSEFASTSDLASLDMWSFNEIDERSNELCQKALEKWSWKF